MDAEVREVDSFKVADEQSVEADFQVASGVLTADLARKYADHIAVDDEHDNGLLPWQRLKGSRRNWTGQPTRSRVCGWMTTL